MFFGAVALAFIAGIKIHDDALLGVFNAPLSWVESQPIGRLLNRFSSDMSAVDNGMANVLVRLSFGLAGSFRI